MVEQGPGSKDSGEIREALLVGVAKEMGIPPSEFLSVSPQERKAFVRSFFRSSLRGIRDKHISNNTRRHIEDRGNRIWKIALEAGIVTPEDKDEIMKE